MCGTESTSGIGAPGGAAVCASADDVYTYISGAASTDASPGPGSKQSLPLGFNLAQMRLLLDLGQPPLLPHPHYYLRV